MEHLASFLHDALWAFGIVLLFAVIGFIATIRWIISLLVKGERAVETGVQNVEHMVTRK